MVSRLRTPRSKFTHFFWKGPGGYAGGGKSTPLAPRPLAVPLRHLQAAGNEQAQLCPARPHLQNRAAGRRLQTPGPGVQCPGQQSLGRPSFLAFQKSQASRLPASPPALAWTSREVSLCVDCKLTQLPDYVYLLSAFKYFHLGIGIQFYLLPCQNPDVLLF